MSTPPAEDKQKAFLERARKGMLTWLAKQEGAAASLGDMHEHSSGRYLIAHQGFSKMMEGLVGEGLVDFDHGTGTATLTDAGRQFIA